MPLVFDSWQFIFQLFIAINGPIWSLLCPIALNNMASILQVPTLTIALLSDVSCGPKLAVVSSQLFYVLMLIYNIFYLSHVISSQPNEHKTFDIISISFTHILFKALTMELYINDLLQCKLRPLNHQSQSMLRDLIFWCCYFWMLQRNIQKTP